MKQERRGQESGSWRNAAPAATVWLLPIVPLIVSWASMIRFDASPGCNSVGAARACGAMLKAVTRATAYLNTLYILASQAFEVTKVVPCI